MHRCGTSSLLGITRVKGFEEAIKMYCFCRTDIPLFFSSLISWTSLRTAPYHSYHSYHSCSYSFVLCSVRTTLQFSTPYRSYGEREVIVWLSLLVMARRDTQCVSQRGIVRVLFYCSFRMQSPCCDRHDDNEHSYVGAGTNSTYRSFSIRRLWY
jgi:hypothetical protein